MKPNVNIFWILANTYAENKTCKITVINKSFSIHP